MVRFVITSMISDPIGQLIVLLPINHNYNKICDISGLIKIKTKDILSFLLKEKIKTHSSLALWCVLSNYFIMTHICRTIIAEIKTVDS